MGKTLFFLRCCRVRKGKNEFPRDELKTRGPPKIRDMEMGVEEMFDKPIEVNETEYDEKNREFTSRWFTPRSEESNAN